MRKFKVKLKIPSNHSHLNDRLILLVLTFLFSVNTFANWVERSQQSLQVWHHVRSFKRSQPILFRDQITPLTSGVSVQMGLERAMAAGDASDGVGIITDVITANAKTSGRFDNVIHRINQARRTISGAGKVSAIAAGALAVLAETLSSIDEGRRPQLAGILGQVLDETVLSLIGAYPAQAQTQTQYYEDNPNIFLRDFFNLDPEEAHSHLHASQTLRDSVADYWTLIQVIDDIQEAEAEVYGPQELHGPPVAEDFYETEAAI